ncbi:3-deoxy-manno-octulosonate cytidylyltransferase [Reticulomyxa filosa]|uniref:3-deoxy-manno-octulosonate cytidylyltransferase n=1 Tax=Reticulomyxa filosa TaxID=46433 RepID=X6LPI9_RETFI|nr:3-deoxy-manno-octulosonate cytidylyltransferase [Reticulomyxa filosa]|eukprot:ETO03823.1 3-deoxy-manno-octulosonate cytidylyltransferase [Reticulomyxa filosa]
MIIRVVEKAIKANIGEVIVASGDIEIDEIVKKYGYNSILTDPDLPSGSDRVYEAFKNLGKNYKYIINLQGDLPLISEQIILAIYKKFKESDADIATAASKIHVEEEANNPNNVKVIMNDKGKALYFTRAKAPWGNGDLWHHIGIYGYKQKALERFVNLPLSNLELREKLEQLRALENDMNISVTIVEDFPLGVDTEEDLAKVRKLVIGG